MRLLEVVDRIAVAQLDFRDPPFVQSYVAHAADEATGGAQLIAILRQYQVGARTVHAQQRWRGLGALQPGARERQETTQTRQLRRQLGMQRAAHLRCQRLGARHARVGRSQLRASCGDQRERAGEQLSLAALAQQIHDGHQRIQRLTTAAGQLDAHREELWRVAARSGRSRAASPATARGPGRGALSVGLPPDASPDWRDYRAEPAVRPPMGFPPGPVAVADRPAPGAPETPRDSRSSPARPRQPQSAEARRSGWFWSSSL